MNIEQLEKLNKRLREGEALDKNTVRDVLLAFDSMERLTESLCRVMAQEGNWRIPLSDGVRAEVTMHGTVSAAHVKVFAKIFSAIAADYVAPSPAPEPGSEKE